MSGPPLVLVHNFPSTFECRASIMVNRVSPLFQSGARKMETFPVFGSSLAICACPIMASQMFPSLSIVIMRLPVGKPGFDTGTG